MSPRILIELQILVLTLTNFLIFLPLPYSRALENSELYAYQSSQTNLALRQHELVKNVKA